MSLTRKCLFFLPLRSLQRVNDLEIPASPLLLWQAVPLGLPPPPQHVALRMSAHGDYRTSLFCTSCNAFKSRDAPAATTCVQSARTTCNFSGHVKTETAPVVKKTTWPASKGSILAAGTNAETCTICKNWRRLYKKSVIKLLAQSAWLAHLSALFYFCSEALLSVIFL